MHRKLLALAATLLALAASPAAADSIRSWVDRDGVVHYTNVKPGRSKKGGARYEKMSDGGVRVVIEGSDQPQQAVRTPIDRYRPKDSDAYDAHLREACERYRIPYPLARAVIATESNFNPGAVSHAGAVGLMQLMPATAVSMYVDDIFDPRENIHGGVRYLRVLTNEFNGDLVKVIAAYNAGPDAVRKAGGIPDIAETQEYVKRVLYLYRQYKAAEAI